MVTRSSLAHWLRRLAIPSVAAATVLGGMTAAPGLVGEAHAAGQGVIQGCTNVSSGTLELYLVTPSGRLLRRTGSTGGDGCYKLFQVPAEAIWTTRAYSACRNSIRLQGWADGQFYLSPGEYESGPQTSITAKPQAC